jgi:hypothetical protein
VKYTNGFFVFRFISKNNRIYDGNLNAYGVWENCGLLSDYEMYLYSWLEKDPFGFKRKFEQAPVWINHKREIVIVFLRSKQVVESVLLAIEKKFDIECIPFELSYKSRIQNDGEVVILSSGVNEIKNKVDTSLINNHIQRASIVESVLSGG